MRRLSRRTQVILGIAVVAIVATCLWFGLASMRTSGTKAQELYVCPMHPQVVQDHPGDCPICGMKLVRRTVEPARGEDRSMAAGHGGGRSALPGGVVGTGGGVSADSLAGTVSLSPSQEIMANVAVAPAEIGKYTSVLTLPGRVVAVEGNDVRVALKAEGRIEKLYVSTTGERVREGEPLLEYYSPDIGAAKRELLLAYESSGQDRDVLVGAAKSKLRSLGLSENQIEDVKPGTVASDLVTVTSPIAGVVAEKMARQGQWMTPGMDAYDVVDLSSVWIEGVAYEADIGRIHLGDEIEATAPAYPGEKLVGTISWISPVLGAETRGLPFRVTIPNPAMKLRPEMYVQVRLVQGREKEAVLLPEDAVLHLGESQIVYVEVAPGRFVARAVVTGVAEGGRVPVYSGINLGEMVVVSGGYLIDSDAKIRSVGQAAHAGHASAPAAAHTGHTMSGM